MKARTRLSFVLALLGSLIASSPDVSAQSLLQQDDQILSELKAIRQLLEKLAGPLGQQPAGPIPTAAAPADDHVTLANVTGYALGKPDAPLTMVEFTDVQCPFCRQFHVTAYEQIKKDYVDTGKLRYLSRDLPLDSIHPFALGAARAARCAAGQGKFWEMRHTILVNNAALTNDVFDTFAQDLKLNVATFKGVKQPRRRRSRPTCRKISPTRRASVSPARPPSSSAGPAPRASTASASSARSSMLRSTQS